MFRLAFITLSLIAIFGSLAWGRYEMRAVDACGAFDNLKHTKNTNNLTLQPGSTYTIMRKHQGQMLVYIKGHKHPQRWVDASCLKPIHDHPLDFPSPVKHKASSDFLLALSWHEAFCETHRNRKECRTSTPTGFVLHGLWPQPKDKIYCGVSPALKRLDKQGRWHKLPEPKLTPQTRRALHRIMPGVQSYLHRHQWIKHGTCYGNDAESYFGRSVALVEAFRRSKLLTLFEAHRGKPLRLDAIRYSADRSFGKGAGKSIEMVCKHGMIVELRLHLQGVQGDSLGEMLRRNEGVKSRCKRGMVDRAGFQLKR